MFKAFLFTIAFYCNHSPAICYIDSCRKFLSNLYIIKIVSVSSLARRRYCKTYGDPLCIAFIDNFYRNRSVPAVCLDCMHLTHHNFAICGNLSYRLCCHKCMLPIPAPVISGTAAAYLPEFRTGVLCVSRFCSEYRCIENNSPISGSVIKIFITVIIKCYTAALANFLHCRCAPIAIYRELHLKVLIESVYKR